MGCISIISSIISIILAICSICFAYKESQKSERNYNETQKLLERIQEVALSNRKDIGIVNEDLSEL